MCHAQSPAMIMDSVLRSLQHDIVVLLTMPARPIVKVFKAFCPPSIRVSMSFNFSRSKPNVKLHIIYYVTYATFSAFKSYSMLVIVTCSVQGTMCILL